VRWAMLALYVGRLLILGAILARLVRRVIPQVVRLARQLRQH
jgi:hypothetical protein